MEIIALRAKLDPDELRQYLRSQIASVATDTPEETASAVPVTVEVDWGRVLDNFGPEGSPRSSSSSGRELAVAALR